MRKECNKDHDRAYMLRDWHSVEDQTLVGVLTDIDCGIGSAQVTVARYITSNTHHSVADCPRMIRRGNCPDTATA